jgi:proton-translocating NAD(P)+ transhydrogenase subunit alpha
MAITVTVPRETAPGERRVALVPDGAKALKGLGATVRVERGAGVAASFSDDAYAAAGAELIDSGLGDAELIIKVQRPSVSELASLPPGAVLISLVGAGPDAQALPARLAERHVTALALERVPRITRAQSMDVLSSQATVAGYKAVLVAASELGKLFPMLTTAAGSLVPSKVFVIGAGVAGLQAIATARRLGAVVSAFDVRPAAREQVLSLGATFVAADTVSASAEGAGGYARAQTDDEQARTLAALAAHIPNVDVVITTAQIPGRPAPKLITKEMVAAMKPGSVIVDLAAESGGNCELTRAGETVEANGVRIVGAGNLPATVPLHASLMFSKNMVTLLGALIKDGSLKLDPDDEITKAMMISHDGVVK